MLNSPREERRRGNRHRSRKRHPRPHRRRLQTLLLAAWEPTATTQPSARGGEKGDPNDLLYASIAAIKDGKIIAKIDPSTGGAEQRNAFLALRREVEMKLERILQV